MIHCFRFNKTFTFQGHHYPICLSHINTPINLLSLLQQTINGPTLNKYTLVSVCRGPNFESPWCGTLMQVFTNWQMHRNYWQRVKSFVTGKWFNSFSHFSRLELTNVESCFNGPSLMWVSPAGSLSNFQRNLHISVHTVSRGIKYIWWWFL